jgi:hypothetical protein
VWPKSKQEIDKNTVDQRDDEADVKENHQIDDKKLPKDDSARILLIEAGIRSLKKPLWIIILLLIIMLFK